MGGSKDGSKDHPPILADVLLHSSTNRRTPGPPFQETHFSTTVKDSLWRLLAGVEKFRSKCLLLPVFMQLKEAGVFRGIPVSGTPFLGCHFSPCRGKVGRPAGVHGEPIASGAARKHESVYGSAAGRLTARSRSRNSPSWGAQSEPFLVTEVDPEGGRSVPAKNCHRQASAAPFYFRLAFGGVCLESQPTKRSAPFVPGLRGVALSRNRKFAVRVYMLVARTKPLPPELHAICGSGRVSVFFFFCVYLLLQLEGPGFLSLGMVSASEVDFAKVCLLFPGWQVTGLLACLSLFVFVFCIFSYQRLHFLHSFALPCSHGVNDALVFPWCCFVSTSRAFHELSFTLNRWIGGLGLFAPWVSSIWKLIKQVPASPSTPN